MPARWTGGLARAAYATLLRLATPLYLLKLWRRGAQEPLYRQFWAERLGWQAADAKPGAVWVHAVSLGETRAATPLIQALREQLPGMRLLLTHSTATGREAGQSLLQSGDQQAWLPYDTPGAVRRFLRHHQPRVGVLMETEIWPVLQHEARQAGVPMVLVNARLSERSAAKGRRFSALLGPAAQALTLALAQTEADARRLREAGVPDVRVMGNLKYDLSADAALLGAGHALRDQMAPRAVILAAVTREGEEMLLLQAWARALPALESVLDQRPLLLIVPRHPQRFDEVAQLVSQAGQRVIRKSGLPTEALPASEELAQADVCLGDTMREMPLYYGMADLALLGGSFAPLGGQNLIEAAACACPLLAGPHTFNFAQATELALDAGAAERVADFDEALARAQVLLQDRTALKAMARRAQDFAAAHRGAARHMAQAIAELARRPH